MEKIAFLNDTDFLDKVKSIFTNSNFWAPALAATLGTGAIGGLMAASSKRHKETPRQRRRRILRSILVPSLLTGTAVGLGGLGAAAYNMDDVRFGDPALAKAERDILSNQSALNLTGKLVGGGAGMYATGRLQRHVADNLDKIVGKTIAEDIRNLGGKAGTRVDAGIDLMEGKLKNKIKNPKLQNILGGTAKNLKKLKGRAAVFALPALGAYYGGSLGSSIQNQLSGPEYDQTDNIVPTSSVKLQALINKIF